MRPGLEILNMEQGSEEWREVRLGTPTASQFHRIITPTGKLSAQREAYMAELLAEWALGQPDDEFSTEWTQRGTILEPYAFKAYAFVTDMFPDKVGFCRIGGNNGRAVGCSPDALVGDKGGLELKCPKAANHLIYLFRDEVPRQYEMQVQGSLWVTGREWWDFASYHPELPTFIKRSEPNEKLQAAFDDHIPLFVEELEAAKKRLKEMGIDPVMEEL